MPSGFYTTDCPKYCRCVVLRQVRQYSSQCGWWRSQQYQQYKTVQQPDKKISKNWQGWPHLWVLHGVALKPLSVPPFFTYNTLKINLMSFWFPTFQSNFERFPTDWQLSTTYQSVLLVAADSLDDMWLCSSAPLIAGVALQNAAKCCKHANFRFLVFGRGGGKKNKLWQQHTWAKTCKNNEKKQQQQLLVQILVAAPLPIFHCARGLLWSTLNGFLSTIPSRRLVLVFATEIVHIFWINIFVLQYFSVNARLFVYMKLYVFITVYDNYITCRWHGSCWTYPNKSTLPCHLQSGKKKLHKSRVICTVLRKKITWHGTSGTCASKKCKTCHVD